MNHRVPRILCFVSVSYLMILGSGLARRATVLGIDGDRFTVNGKPEFLLGISAMDAIGKLQGEDLDWLRERGFRLVRVWPYWAQKLLDQHAPGVPRLAGENILWNPDGSVRPAKLAQLRQLLEMADRRGVVIDITAFHTFLGFSDDPDLEIRRRALREMCVGIRPYRNVLLDLYNEHNNYGFMTSHADLRILRDEVKAVDKDRIVTASNVHGAFGRVPLEEVLPFYLSEMRKVRLDVMTPHFIRTRDFAVKTAPRLQLLKGYLQGEGFRVPIYLQEEARRRHSNLNPGMAEFLLSARSAKENGAAAWVLHTDAGYNLSAGSLRSLLDDVERSVAERVADVLAEVQE